MYYAHSKEGLDKSKWQCLKDHLTNTANLAAELGRDAGISELARTAALLPWVRGRGADCGGASGVEKCACERSARVGAVIESD